MEEESISGSAPAKLNLTLRITGVRADGYHLLDSFFLPLSAPADDLEILLDEAPGVTVSCSEPGVPTDLTNLAARAAMAFAERCGIDPAWHIHIEKNVPVAAGMGGGSSDAAAVLRLLNTRFDEPLTEEELAALALLLGADVPFFIAPRPGIVTGIGEHFEGLDFELPELPLVWIDPGFPISTKWSYAHWQSGASPVPPTATADLVCALRENDLEKVGRCFANDLATAALAKFPLLTLLREAALRNGALAVGMTGSGPAHFALVPDWQTAETLAEALRAEFPACRMEPTQAFTE